MDQTCVFLYSVEPNIQWKSLGSNHCLAQKNKPDRLWPTWGWVNAAEFTSFFLVTLNAVLYCEYLMPSCLNIALSIAKTLKFSPSSKLQRCNPCLVVANLRVCGLFLVLMLLDSCKFVLWLCVRFFSRFTFKMNLYRWLASLFCIWSHRAWSV